MTTLTREAAELLAKFIHDVVRPEWDERGIVKALGEARAKGTAGTVAVAAIVAAQNRDNRTPGVIPLAGPHWAVPGAVPPRREVPPRAQTCATCYLGYDECRRRWHWDHEFESIVDAKRRAIAQADTIPRHLKREPAEFIKGRRVVDVELP